jgi:hypothetical protein
MFKRYLRLLSRRHLLQILSHSSSKLLVGPKKIYVGYKFYLNQVILDMKKTGRADYQNVIMPLGRNASKKLKQKPLNI